MSDRFIIYTSFDAFEATFETMNEWIIVLESQIASKDRDASGNMDHLDSLEGKNRIAEERALLMLANIREDGLRLHVAKAARFRAKAVLCSAEFQFQDFCSSAS